VPEALRRFHPVLAGPQALVFRYGRGSGAADEILAAVRSAGLLVRDLTTSQADLEQVFLDLLRRS
jgi:hypothetical protein